MRRARPPRDDRNTRAAGQFADRFGHIRGGRFVTAHDGLDAFGLIVQRIQHSEKTLAGYTENTFDTMGEQGIDNETRASGLSGDGT